MQQCLFRYHLALLLPSSFTELCALVTARAGGPPRAGTCEIWGLEPQGSGPEQGRTTSILFPRSPYIYQSLSTAAALAQFSYVGLGIRWMSWTQRLSEFKVIGNKLL